MLEEMTGVNGETVHKILAEDLKKEKTVCSFCPSFANAESKTSTC
jgi:hypothetical protein